MNISAYKIATFFSIIWALCVLGVISVIAYASSLMTIDPDFPFGSPKLILMLSFFFVGSIAFMLTCVFSLVAFIRRKKEAHDGLFGIRLFPVIALVIILLFGTFSFLFGYRQSNIANWEIDTNYSGQDAFEAINKYRVGKNLKQLELQPQICNNIVDRWLMMKKNEFNGHAGFEEWVNQERMLDYYGQVAEMYTIDALSTDEAIEFWVGSPGHRLSLEGDYDFGCAYANDGIIVAVLATKK